MPDHTPINPNHDSTRRALRIAGPLVLGLGGLFMVVGFVDFFSSVNSFRGPTLFWCFFVGMPLLFVGGVLTSAGFAGKVARYYSQEYTPVATDTFKYAARESKDGIREIAGAIREGMSDHPDCSSAPKPALTAAQRIHILRCHRCNHDNPAEARFCSQCGVALAKQVPCQHCKELNDPDAKFCDNCGRPAGG